MDLSDLLQFARTTLKEIWLNRVKVIFGSAIVAFAVLFIGMTMPSAYESSMTLYADNQNILKPLLEKQAEVSRVQDQVRVVRDVMLSPRILTEVIETVFPEYVDMLPGEKEQLVSDVRGRIDISSLGKSYIKVTYSDKSADTTYQFISKLTDTFIKDSSETQRSESKQAFTFIDGQVKNYKEQLVLAEDKLKAFQAANTDGTAVDVDSRISRLREEMEELTLNRDGQKIKIQSLEDQLSEENRFSAKKYKTDVYRERLAQLNTTKEALLLTYKEDYPDVVAVNLQIEDMERAIAFTEQDEVAMKGESSINPLYRELRSKLADAKVALFTTQRRLDAITRLVEEENFRRKRIASRDAELAELTRDYNVTKKIYEEMLERKENARLSMTLNLQGQGVSYKIQEPAIFPLAPSGLTFRHFVIAGLVLGIILPVGLVVLYIIVDPRIRAVGLLREMSDLPVLTSVHHTPSPFSNRLMSADMFFLGFLVLVYLGLYLGLALGHRAGVLM